MKRPYVLAVASHKGGTGRTTAALALAWTWGQVGMNVTLLDADPVQAATLIGTAPNGRCGWPNVRLVSATACSDWPDSDADLVVVDCPSLTEVAALAVLEYADGVLLTCLPDLLSLRTLPAATRVLAEAQNLNSRLSLLGLFLPIVHEPAAEQRQALQELRGLHAGLLLEPSIPFQSELRAWPLAPGTDLPDGPARRAYAEIADTLASNLGLVAAAPSSESR